MRGVAEKDFMLIGRSVLNPASFGEVASSQTRRASVSDLTKPSGTGFVGRLEKHLDDVRKNKGYLSKGVNVELSGQDRANNNFLSGSAPKLLADYAGYSSIFAYDKRARFVSGVRQSTEALGRLNNSDKIIG